MITEKAVQNAEELKDALAKHLSEYTSLKSMERDGDLYTLYFILCAFIEMR